MKAVMIGAGYVGLTIGGCFAELGHEVCCCDIDEAKLAMPSRGRLPIFERSLDALVAANREKGRMTLSSDLAASVSAAELVFLAVGTPSDANGDIDLSHIEEAARIIAPFLGEETVVVIKLTVVAGTAPHVANLIADQRGGRRVAVASNPEFLREGSAIADFMNADRIVVGADDAMSAGRIARLYEPRVREGIPYLETSTANAELIKYASNAFLALKIGFINDVTDLCERAEGDVAAVARGVGLDRRIGTAFLSPGPGFGGSCFPKDMRAFAATGRRFEAAQRLVETLIERNEERKKSLAGRIALELASCQEQGTARKLAILGTAFKANTDDVREAPALTIIPLLQQAGAHVHAHDPQAQLAAERHLTDIVWHPTPYEAAGGADLVVILTEWDEYRELDLERLARVMRGNGIVDYRNMLDGAAITRSGLHYISLGRVRAIPTRSRGRWNRHRGLGGYRRLPGMNRDVGEPGNSSNGRKPR